MGNCLNKLRKNKVCQDPGAIIQGTKNRVENISEILGMFSTSPSKIRGMSNDESKMVENLVCPDEDKMKGGLEAEIMKNEETSLVELHDDALDIQKPVFFQVDFAQGMRKMPPRLASRMGHRHDEKKYEQNTSPRFVHRMGKMHDEKKSEQMKLTDEDELMMDEIMEEYDRKEKLKELEDQLKAANCLRQQHLQNTKDKARQKRPPTRACVSRVD